MATAQQALNENGVPLWSWAGISDDGCSVFPAPDAETAERLALGQVRAGLIDAGNDEETADTETARAWEEGEVDVRPVFFWTPTAPVFAGEYGV